MKKQNVLIVDDEPRNQRILIEILEDLFDYKVASSGENAIEILQTYIPDLVLLDIMMPGIDGYQVCTYIRSKKELSLTKVLLVSGKAMVEERLKGYEVGGDDYITKPFVPEELLAKTKVFLKLTAAEKEVLALNQSLEQKVVERTQQLLDAEAKLVNSAKMAALGEMAGGIAHEINTPLGTIAMIADQMQEIVQETAFDPSTISEMSQILTDTVKRISSVVYGLRTFSREGSSDIVGSESAKQLVENTLALCMEKIKHSNIDIRVAPISEQIRIACRAVQISQVLLNLVNNACDAISALPEKWIKIEVKETEGWGEITITDSGPGIPEAVRLKIFDPFFTTKALGKGTGLGLSISKGIVDSHNGTLTIDEKCSNTRFILRLPVGKAAGFKPVSGEAA